MRAAILSTIGFLVLAGPASAQRTRPLADLELAELMRIEVQSVFGASKFLQKVTDAPAAVSVITARDIALHGYRTLADILRSVPGFNVTDDRNYSFVGVRGFQRPGDFNSRVLLLVDGHRMNEPIYNQAYIGTEFALDVELMERVELIRGPSSSIYGTNAFLAVINVVTKKGRALNGLQIGGGAGSLQTGKARAAFGASFENGLDVLVSGSRHRSRGQKRLYFGEFDDPATNHGMAENLDGGGDYRLFTSLSFKGLVFQGGYGARKKRVPTASFESWFNDSRLETRDAQGWADLRYGRTLPAGWQLTNRLYFDRAAYDGRYPSDVSETAEPSVTLFGDFAYSLSWGTEVNLMKAVATRHKVTFGGEYRNLFRLEQGRFAVDGGVPTFDDRRRSHESAVFVEDQYTIHQKLLLNAGLRVDRYQAFGNTTNPRLGLIFKPVEKTAIKALWGSAFRAPNGYELFYSSSVLIPNPRLAPERIRTAEIVIERYFADRYRLMTSVYSSRVRGLINQQINPDGSLIFQNLDSAATKGVEAEVEGKWSSGIGGRASYSFQHATDLGSGKRLTTSARHLATGSLTLPLIRGHASGALDLHYVGPVETLKGGFTRAFAVSNLTLSTREFNNRLTVSAAARNLFNVRYGYPGGDEHRQNIIYQDGRTFHVGAEYSWRVTK